MPATNHKIDQALNQSTPDFKAHISCNNAYMLYGVEIFAEPNHMKK
jgi:hypothetical protein